MTPKDALILIAEIKKFTEKLNAWETQFLGNVTGYRAISDKQSVILTRIYEKVTGGGAWTKKQYFKK